MYSPPVAFSSASYADIEAPSQSEFVSGNRSGTFLRRTETMRLSQSEIASSLRLVGKTGNSNRSGISSYVRPASLRPVLLFLTPPHCLKKKRTPARSHWSRIEVTHDSDIGRAP